VEFDGLLTGAPFDRLRGRVAELRDDRHDLDAARLGRLIASLDRVVAELREVDRLRRLEACVLAPGLEPGSRVAYVVRAGQLAVHRVDPGCDPRARSEGAGPAPAFLEADRLDELLVVSSFLSAPPPELSLLAPVAA
jgi:hypothetical protein